MLFSSNINARSLATYPPASHPLAYGLAAHSAGVYARSGTATHLNVRIGGQNLYAASTHAHVHTRALTVQAMKERWELKVAIIPSGLCEPHVPRPVKEYQH